MSIRGRRPHSPSSPARDAASERSRGGRRRDRRNSLGRRRSTDRQPSECAPIRRRAYASDERRRRKPPPIGARWRTSSPDARAIVATNRQPGRSSTPTSLVAPGSWACVPPSVFSRLIPWASSNAFSPSDFNASGFSSLASAPISAPAVLTETEIEAADASSAIREAVEARWPPRAVRLRLLDLEGREIFERLKADLR